MPTDANLPQRIKSIYNTCSPEEQQLLIQILEEISETGHSDTYENLWLQDYKEIPVDKYTFLTSSEYLGLSNNNGQSIYPAWMDMMLELERTGNKYYEIVLTGATRTGKTSTAVSDAAYQLYKMMCLRNPQEYFGLKAATTISFLFFNITTTLASGVAYREFNSTISTSPWFMRHGKMNNSLVHPVYMPEGGLITIEYGSDSSHALGKATSCLTGDTIVQTISGLKTLDELKNSDVYILQYDENTKRCIYVPAYVIQTKLTQDIIEVELENGFCIRGTPDHKVLLSDGRYVELQNLTETDDILYIPT